MSALCSYRVWVVSILFFSNLQKGRSYSCVVEEKYWLALRQAILVGRSTISLAPQGRGRQQARLSRGTG